MDSFRIDLSITNNYVSPIRPFLFNLCFFYNLVISQYLSESKHVPLWNFVYETTRLNKWPVPWRHILAINSTFRDYRQLCKVAIEASISSARSRCQIFPWIQLQVYNPPPPPPPPPSMDKAVNVNGFGTFTNLPAFRASIQRFWTCVEHRGRWLPWHHVLRCYSKLSSSNPWVVRTNLISTSVICDTPRAMEVKRTTLCSKGGGHQMAGEGAMFVFFWGGGSKKFVQQMVQKNNISNK